jgi:hypothetical protein
MIFYAVICVSRPERDQFFNRTPSSQKIIVLETKPVGFIPASPVALREALMGGCILIPEIKPKGLR